MNKTKLTIAIPASVISDTPHLREKTSKVGLIGRAAAIFRIDQIIVYPDNPKANQTSDLELVALLLEYLETPQYLRKRLFKLEPRLQYAGILPPLRTPHHPLSGKTKDLNVGGYREGAVISEGKEGLLVDIGVEKPALLREKQFALGERLTLQAVKVGDQVEVQAVSREVIPVYWGYKVKTAHGSFVKLVQDGGYDLVVATSKKGDNFQAVAEKIRKKWESAQHVLLAFGPPSRGLYELVRDDGARLKDIADFIVNFIPNQGTETVRTEEALLATLAVLNAQFNL